jgi:drug/metabolite transporter (DMT)-like permease
VTARASGTALVLVSALSFGTLGILAKGATTAGFDTFTLLLVRFGLAVPILLAIALAGRFPWPTAKNMPGLVLMGGLYVGQSLCFFQALNYIPVSLVSLLLYMYPVFVTIASVTMLGERMTRVKWLALSLAVLGSALTIGPVSGGDPVGLLYGLGTALFYAAYLVIGTRAMKGVHPGTGSVVVLSVAAVTYAVTVAFTGFNPPGAASGWAYAVVLAVIPTAVAISTLLSGLEKIGPVNTSTISAIEPLVTALLAAVLLKETLHPIQILGGALILSAVLILARAQTT